MLEDLDIDRLGKNLHAAKQKDERNSNFPSKRQLELPYHPNRKTNYGEIHRTVDAFGDHEPDLNVITSVLKQNVPCCLDRNTSPHCYNQICNKPKHGNHTKRYDCFCKGPIDKENAVVQAEDA